MRPWPEPQNTLPHQRPHSPQPRAAYSNNKILFAPDTVKGGRDQAALERAIKTHGIIAHIPTQLRRAPSQKSVWSKIHTRVSKPEYGANPVEAKAPLLPHKTLNSITRHETRSTTPTTPLQQPLPLLRRRAGRRERGHCDGRQRRQLIPVGVFGGAVMRLPELLVHLELDVLFRCL